MKCNIQKPPKELENLSKTSLGRLDDYYQKMLDDTMDKYGAELQRTYLKYCCIALHEGFGFGKDRCLQFIGNWKRFHHVSMTKNDEERKAWLDEHMAFFNGEYPEEWLKKVEDSEK